MTPEYASPEQVRGEPVTVAATCTRSACCSTSCSPAGGRTGWRARQPLEIERAVLEQEPARPSASVAHRTACAASCAAISTPSCSPRSARNPPGGTRAWKRLADDLRRHLDRAAGRARAPTAWVIAPGSSSAGTASASRPASPVLSLVGGLAATLWQSREATREAARAERVTEFLVSLFREADPEQARGREVTANELLRRGERRLDSTLVQEPDTRARLLGVLGLINTQLGQYGRAESLLARSVALTRQSRGGESPEVAARLADWADALSEEAKLGRPIRWPAWRSPFVVDTSGRRIPPSPSAFGRWAGLPGGAG